MNPPILIPRSAPRTTRSPSFLASSLSTPRVLRCFFAALALEIDLKANPTHSPSRPPPYPLISTTEIMAPRRSSTRGGSSNQSNTRASASRIRKNTRSRQPPSRYGQLIDPSSPAIDTSAANYTASDSVETNPSTPEYSHTPPSNTRTLSRSPISQRTRGPHTELPRSPSVLETRPSPTPPSEASINLSTMRELLRSHEQDIVDRVVLQLRTQPPSQPSTIPPDQLASHYPALGTQPVPHYSVPGTQPVVANPTLIRIAELETQLAELRAANQRDQPLAESRPPGTSYPTQIPIRGEGESASGIVDSVKTLFPGVERSTLVQIIENRFKPTNIYRLLASEKERAETHRTINIGGVEFEQPERDGKESEYRMSSFFKAWAAYCGILIKLGPQALQGELATSLCIYTMNLYDLLEKYTWEGVKSYHFQFHRKQVASGKGIFQPTEWRQLDSQLIASKCFAHPAPRLSWSQTPKLPSGNTRISSTISYPPAERRSNYPLPTTIPLNGIVPGSSLSVPAAQPCRNWNYRECKLTQCRYQHSCISCGSSHRASQCTLGNNSSSYTPRNPQPGR